MSNFGRERVEQVTQRKHGVRDLQGKRIWLVLKITLSRFFSEAYAVELVTRRSLKNTMQINANCRTMFQRINIPHAENCPLVIYKVITCMIVCHYNVDSDKWIIINLKLTLGELSCETKSDSSHICFFRNNFDLPP